MAARSALASDMLSDIEPALGATAGKRKQTDEEPALRQLARDERLSHGKRIVANRRKRIARLPASQPPKFAQFPERFDRFSERRILSTIPSLPQEFSEILACMRRSYTVRDIPT